MSDLLSAVGAYIAAVALVILAHFGLLILGVVEFHYPLFLALTLALVVGVAILGLVSASDAGY